MKIGLKFKPVLNCGVLYCLKLEKFLVMAVLSPVCPDGSIEPCDPVEEAPAPGPEESRIVLPIVIK